MTPIQLGKTRRAERGESPRTFDEGKSGSFRRQRSVDSVAARFAPWRSTAMTALTAEFTALSLSNTDCMAAAGVKAPLR